jgi:hypothetical protein
MPTIFFVHGTGVRRQAYNDLYALLNRECTRYFPHSVLRTCYWGDACGARLRHAGVSIPRFTAADTRGLDAGDDEDLQVWGRLYEDPLYELRVLAAGGGAERSFSPDESDVDAVVERFRHWAPDALVRAAAEDGGIGRELPDARDAVLVSEAFEPAVAGATDDEADALVDVLARAVVASALWTCGAGGHVPRAAIDADLRDRLVGQIAAMLAGRSSDSEARALKDVLTAPVTAAISRAGTFYVQRSRGDVFDAATPVAGDIVLYQTRGEPFLEFIASEIKDAPRPLVLLTHSLGGVACVDLLALAARRGEALPVDLLVTVGSQAPFLYEIGALRSLRADEPLPDGFPAWLNVYAARDFLSYKANDLFPAAIDVEVDIRQPFPRSHSAYWATAGFWTALDTEFRKRSWL